MADEIKEVITRAIQSARINGQRARIEGEYLDIIGCRILEDLHAAGYEIVPGWSDDLDAAPRDKETEVDLFVPGFGRVLDCTWKGDKDGSDLWLSKNGLRITQPTHWRPSSNPPKESE